MEKDYLILKTQVPQFRTGLLVRAGTVLACSRLSLSGALQKSGGTIEGDHGEPQVPSTGYGGVDRRDKFGLWRPYRIPSPASPYSLAAMKLTTFDSDCICLTILPTSSFGSLVSERRMR